ncbi:MAG: hypothetical protein LBI11_00245, partial [Streptococcaceae bacterium]|nr:hypothetical protein [Streptococcaceae bacterium]
MKSGYCQPLDGNFRLAWIWWVSLIAFQQVLFFENNLQFDGFNTLLLILAAAYLYFLIRQRRFFVSKHHLYFTKDFRLN